MTPQNTDQVARDIAHSALAAIQQHEAVCEERAILATEQRANMVASMQRLESAGRVYAISVGKQMEALQSRFWLAAMGVIGGFFSVAVMLADLLIQRH